MWLLVLIIPVDCFDWLDVKGRDGFKLNREAILRPLATIKVQCRYGCVLPREFMLEQLRNIEGLGLDKKESAQELHRYAPFVNVLYLDFDLNHKLAQSMAKVV